MATAGESDTEPERYAHINVAGGDECVIYDRENESAWVQSTISVAVEDLD